MRELRLRFDTPPDSPEWVFYATLAPLLDGPGEAIAEEVQAAVVQGARSAGRELALAQHRSGRTVIAFALGAVAVGVISAYVASFERHASVVLIATVAFVVGIAATTVYYELSGRVR